jgi:hypothetical protein
VLDELSKGLAAVFLIVVIGAILQFHGVGNASPATTLAIDPNVGGKAPNELYSVNVTVFEVSNLYTWQFNITFNPSVLEVVSVVEGPFLKQVGTTLFPTPIVNNTFGFVQAACARFPYDAGANGSGVLGTVNFRVRAEGQSQLHFLPIGTETKLRLWNGAILVPISFVAFDGSFSYPLFELVRDVAVTDVAVSSLTVVAGGKVSVNVTVANRGNLTESFDVSLYCDSWVIGSQTVSGLFSGVSRTLVFEWDTKNVNAGDFVLTATASTVAGETNAWDNSFSYAAVTVADSPPPLPIELIVLAVVVVAVVVIAVVLLFRKRG